MQSNLRRSQPRHDPKIDIAEISNSIVEQQHDRQPVIASNRSADGILDRSLKGFFRRSRHI
jgi:hypothetical protein